MGAHCKSRVHNMLPWLVIKITGAYCVGKYTKFYLVSIKIVGA